MSCPHCEPLMAAVCDLLERHLKALEQYDSLQRNTENLAKLVDSLRWQLMFHGIQPDYLLEFPPKKLPVAINTRQQRCIS